MRCSHRYRGVAVPSSHVAIYVHLIWATWDREPLLTPELASRAQRVVADKARECGAEMLAIGDVENHLHLLVRLPATLDVATFVKRVKGGSAYFIARHLAPGSTFRWQGSYGAVGGRWERSVPISPASASTTRRTTRASTGKSGCLPGRGRSVKRPGRYGS